MPERGENKKETREEIVEDSPLATTSAVSNAADKRIDSSWLHLITILYIALAALRNPYIPFLLAFRYFSWPLLLITSPLLFLFLPRMPKIPMPDSVRLTSFGMISAFLKGDGTDILKLLDAMTRNADKHHLNYMRLGPSGLPGNSHFLLTQADIKAFKTDHEKKLSPSVAVLDIFGRTLINVGGNEWTEMRTAVMHQIHTSQILKGQFSGFSVFAQTLINEMQTSDREISLVPMVQKYVIRCMFKLLYNVYASQNNIDTLAIDFVEELTATLFNFATLLQWLPAALLAEWKPEGFLPHLFAQFLKWRFGSETADGRPAICTNLITKFQRLKDAMPKGRALSPFESMLDEQCEKLGDDKAGNMLASELFFFGASITTTVSTLVFAIENIATHPDFQTKLQSSLKDAPPLTQDNIMHLVNGNIATAPLHSFEPLRAAVLETLRHDPANPLGMVRFAAEDFTFALTSEHHQVPHTVKKYDTLFTPPGCYQNRAGEHPQPEEFNPYRYIGDKSSQETPPAPFVPGPRQCIGDQAALVVIYTLLAPLFKAYQITARQEGTPGKKFVGSLMPKHGIFVQAKPKNDSVIDVPNTGADDNAAPSSLHHRSGHTS